MSNEYRNTLDEKNTDKINELLNGMPEFIEDYYDSLVAKGRSTNTIKSYLYEVGVFLKFVATIVKKKNINDIYVTDLDKFTRPLLLDSEGENALFLSTQHKRMGVSSIEKMVKKYCKAAGLSDNISPHKLRATFATTVYKQTKDIYAVKDALHHKSIDTSKHYIGDKEERKQSAAIAAGSMFN